MVPCCRAQASCALLLALLLCARGGGAPQGSNGLIGRVQELEQQLAKRLLPIWSSDRSRVSSSSDSSIGIGSNSSNSTSDQIPSDEIRPPAPTPPTSDGFPGTASLPSQVLLSYYASSGDNPNKHALNCKGADCPHFAACEPPSQRHLSGLPQVDACWNAAFHDPGVMARASPKNCPRLYHRDDITPEGHNPKCSQASDFVPHMPMAMQVFRLDSVRVDTRGTVTAANEPTNSSDSVVPSIPFVFHYGGCNPSEPAAVARSARASKRVRRVRVGVNLAYHWGHKFYHALTETLPAFYVMAAILRHNPDAAILLAPRQWKLYISVLEPILGVPFKSLKKVEIRPWETVHVERMYQPVYAPCGWHSLSLWRSLREKVLLPSRGVPAFTASWYPRSGVVSIEEAALGLPSRGLVVLAQRNRKERSLMQSDQIFKLLGQVFPTHKVVVFEGDMGILEAREIFRRAVIFIGAHGAALANMVFMPSGTTVVEIRPKDYPNTCFNSLASTCQIEYHLLLSEGTKSSRLTVDMSELERVLRRIRVGGPAMT